MFTTIDCKKIAIFDKIQPDPRSVEMKKRDENLRCGDLID